MIGWNDLAHALDGSRAHPRLLPRHRRRNCSARSATAWPGTSLANEHARVVVEKPIGKSLEIRPRGERRRRPRLPGRPHLPDRPLSREGDGAEPDGAALRQRPVRAALERRPYRPCRRSPWPKRSASKAAPATTTPPARCATWCRTTCCNSLCLIAMEPPTSLEADAVRDEKLKVLKSLVPINAGHGRREYRARPVPRRRLGSDGPVKGYLDELGHPRQPHRNLRRPEGGNRQLALGRRAVLPALAASACPPACRRSSIAFRPIPHSVFDHAAGPIAPTSWSSACSPMKA